MSNNKKSKNMKTALTIEQYESLVKSGIENYDASMYYVSEYKGSEPILASKDSVFLIFSNTNSRFVSDTLTIPELIDILPKTIDNAKLIINATDNGYNVAYVGIDEKNSELTSLFCEETELIDALYVMLMYLLDEKLINI